MSNVRPHKIMLFGATNTFAIEALVDEPRLVGVAGIWGSARVWCQDVPIGDINERHCALGPIYEHFKELEECLPLLWSREFDGLSDTGLFDHLDVLLFGWRGDVEVQDGRTAEQCGEDAQVYGRHIILTNWGEQFDRSGKSFIFNLPTGLVRVLRRDPQSRAVISLQFLPSEMQSSIRSFAAWYESELGGTRGGA